MPVAALVHRGVPGELDHDVGHDRPVVDHLAGAPPGGEAAVLPGMVRAARIQQAADLPPGTNGAASTPSLPPGGLCTGR
ncbi:hypothetical protein AQJ11_33580 [Streptomyces corchorusii]|uniref:Uncharacterized protein n=2 Tax=Streptomyces TaxID=1883 RepID=A0A117QB72_STRCK|nr:hypothetical protein [Streptomyces corchorusii]KUN18716.1 hypothetical protein AQJ11_33580 [Streptomyces corchorusii]